MKIIVIDDDPTGSQTVNDCLLLLRWDYKTLLEGFKSKSKLFFILANTRALSEEDVQKRLKEICNSINYIIKNEGYENEEIIFVSRGDSTLRGHNFLEPNLINTLLGPFDATFHIPAFLEGNRITMFGKHFVENIPAHQTVYAKDKIFGYETNNIGELLCMKSHSKLNLCEIKNLIFSDIEKLDLKNSNKVFQFLSNLNNNNQVIVVIKNYYHLEKFCSAILKLIPEKRFLFRTAASFISTISNSKQIKKGNSYFSNLRRKNDKNEFSPGLFIIGSHIELSTIQLSYLLESQSVKQVELNVTNFYNIFKLKDNKKQLLQFKKELLSQIKFYLNKKITPIFSTSRKFIVLNDNDNQSTFQYALAIFIAELVKELRNDLSYIISKGGITTNTILSNGLDSNYVYLEGQIFPGISIVTAKLENCEKPLPVITFPGNIGDKDTLVKIWNIFEYQ